MIVDNDYLKYDMTLEEYYITKDCVTNYTNYSSDELGAIGINDKVLKMISHSVYRVIYEARKSLLYKNEHKKYMRKKIYDNENEEVTSLMYAILEAVKGAVESGMDLNAYINEPKNNMPYTVIEELKSSELYDRSQKPINDLDIDYTTAEIARWQ